MAINRSRFTSLALLLGLLTSGGGISCTTAYAQQWPPSYERPIEPMQFRWLDVALVDDVGRSFEYTRHRGRYYVAGEEEQSYSIELHNRTPTRVEVVVTVDGRDVVSGALGDYQSQRGYILEPYANLVISGYRQSLSAVAQFRFSAAQEAYATRLGAAENLGVLGIAVFPERRPARVSRQPRCGWRCRRSGRVSASAPRMKSSPSVESDFSADGYDEQALGTEYGDTIYSSASVVEFARRSSRPAEVTAIYYDSYTALSRRGIRFDYQPTAPHQPPDPFPANNFAQPPPANRAAGFVQIGAKR